MSDKGRYPRQKTEASTANTASEHRASKPASKRLVLGWLSGALWAAVLIPPVFYLEFGHVGPLGWGLTVFLMTVCVLVAVGLHFQGRPDYGTPVNMRGGFADRLGGFWLLACALGPLLGWVLCAVTDPTVENWRWLYGGRVALSIVLPVVTALPLLRYVRGKGAPVMLMILFAVTSLPVWSAWTTLQDLQAGPQQVQRANGAIGKPPIERPSLPYTGRTLENDRRR
jgi:hypothetical protein